MMRPVPAVAVPLSALAQFRAGCVSRGAALQGGPGRDGPEKAELAGERGGAIQAVHAGIRAKRLMAGLSGTEFLAGGGEMGALTRAHDWNSSTLGAAENWPQSLRAMIRLMLNTRHPMLILWGPDLIQFYNDAFKETMGPERHPSALGQRGRDCWAEAWNLVGPQIEYVMAGKGSTWEEDRLVPLTRHGRREDVWWTYSYAPIDSDGGIGGVLVICNDVTSQHLARDAIQDHTRRLETLFEQAPGFMAVLRGPEHVFEITNAAYRQLVGEREFLGRSVREVLPEIEGQGFLQLLDDVFRSGTAHVGRRVPVSVRAEPGEPDRNLLLDFVYQPIVDLNGDVSGIFVEGVDVTENVRTENHLRLMNEELKHRVKNTLAMVSAIAAQTLRGAGADAAVAAFYGRLAAFGKAHDALTATTWATAAVHGVIAGALAPYRTGEGRISISGPETIIGSKQALSLALAIHELATNAVKYGALSNEQGRIEVSWNEELENGAPVFRLVWRERDGPPVSPPTKKGFGSQLLTRVLTGDFGGTIDIVYEPTGLVCRLTAPKAKIVPTAPTVDQRA